MSSEQKLKRKHGYIENVVKTAKACQNCKRKWIIFF